MLLIPDGLVAKGIQMVVAEAETGTKRDGSLIDAKKVALGQ